MTGKHCYDCRDTHCPGHDIAALLASYIQAGYTASEGYAEILRRLQAALAEAK
jgi:hypothetical protein